MPHREDTAVHGDEPAAPDPRSHAAVTQPEIAKLGRDTTPYWVMRERSKRPLEGG